MTRQALYPLDHSCSLYNINLYITMRYINYKPIYNNQIHIPVTYSYIFTMCVLD